MKKVKRFHCLSNCLFTSTPVPFWKCVMPVFDGVGYDAFLIFHDDVMKWKHLPRYWPFLRGIHRSPVNSQHKGQRRGALMFSLICARINGWVNNSEARNLRRHHAHCDVTVMYMAVPVIRFSVRLSQSTIYIIRKVYMISMWPDVTASLKTIWLVYWGGLMADFPDGFFCNYAYSYGEFATL